MQMAAGTEYGNMHSTTDRLAVDKNTNLNEP